MNIDQKYFPEFKQQLIDVGDGIKINTLVGGKGSEAITAARASRDTFDLAVFDAGSNRALYGSYYRSAWIWRQQQA
jgi:hypothetical protein